MVPSTVGLSMVSGGPLSQCQQLGKYRYISDKEKLLKEIFFLINTTKTNCLIRHSKTYSKKALSRAGMTCREKKGPDPRSMGIG